MSPIIYKQQIVRALQTGIKHSPVIFDIVLNIENLYSIGSVEEEIQIATSYYRSLGLDDEIVNEHFKIIDEVHDCLELFDRLGETLSASWNLMYEKAKEYYAENGNLEVPKRYVTPGGYTLDAWIRTQRLVYAGKTYGILTDGQIKKLEKIGMRWENIRDMAWQKCFDMSTSYVSDGIWLGKWISEQKKKYKSAKLSAEQVRRLETLGIDWNADIQSKNWEEHLDRIRAISDRAGVEPGPLGNTSEETKKLNAWLRVQRKNYRDGKLSADRISKLQAVGIV